MKFSEFVNPQAIRPQLGAIDKEEVIRELIDGLVHCGDLPADQQDEIVQRILDREKMGTTGIGRGVAVPHAKHPAISQTIGTIGISPDGVAFDALDGGVVHVLFLLLSPPSQSEVHLKVLEKISRHLREDTFCRFLKQATSVAEVQQVLDEVDDSGPV